MAIFVQEPTQAKH